jgi:hypothetical protein
VEHLLTKERGKDILDVAWRYAEGQATDRELNAVHDTAWHAVWDAFEEMTGSSFWDIARVSAWRLALRAIMDVTHTSPWDAAYISAEESARAVSQDAAHTLALGAVLNASWDVTQDFSWEVSRVPYWTVARNAAYVTARNAQREKLVDILQAGKWV